MVREGRAIDANLTSMPAVGSGLGLAEPAITAVEPTATAAETAMTATIAVEPAMTAAAAAGTGEELAVAAKGLRLVESGLEEAAGLALKQS